jgi:hypothetical protein
MHKKAALAPMMLFIFMLLFIPVTAGALLAYFVLAFAAYKAAKLLFGREKRQAL